MINAHTPDLTIPQQDAGHCQNNTLRKFEYYLLGLILFITLISIGLGLQLNSYLLATISFYFLLVMPGQLLLMIIGNQVKEELNLSGSFAASLALLSPFAFAFYFFKGSINVLLWFIWMLNFCMYMYCIIRANSNEHLKQSRYLCLGGYGCFERKQLYSLFAYVLAILLSVAVFITARYQQFGADAYSHISNMQHLIDSDFIPVSGGPLYRNSPDPVYSMNLLYLLYAGVAVMTGSLKGFETYMLSSAFLSLIHLRTIIYLCGIFDLRKYTAQIMAVTIFFYYVAKTIQYKYLLFIHLCEPGVVYSYITLPFALGFILHLSREGKPGKGGLILCGLILASSSAIHLQLTIYIAISLFLVGVCILIYSRLWKKHWRGFLLLLSLFILFSLPYMLYRLSVIDTYSLIKGSGQLPFDRGTQDHFGSITFFDLRTYFTFDNILVLISIGYISLNKRKTLQERQKQLFLCFCLMPFLLFIPHSAGSYVTNAISISLVRRFSSLDTFEFLVIFAIALFAINRRLFLEYRKTSWILVLIPCVICIGILLKTISSQLDKDISRYDMYKIAGWNITRKLAEIKNEKSYFANWLISDVLSAFIPDFSANGRYWLAADGLKRVEGFDKLIDFSVPMSEKSRIIERWNTGFLLFNRNSYAESMADQYLYAPCTDVIENISGLQDANFSLYRIDGDISHCASIQTSVQNGIFEKHVDGLGGIERIRLRTLYDSPPGEHFDWLVDGKKDTFLTWTLGRDVLIEITPIKKGNNSSNQELDIVFSSQHRLFRKMDVLCIDVDGRITAILPRTEVEPSSKLASYLFQEDVKIEKIFVHIQGDKMNQISIAELLFRQKDGL